MPGLAPDTERLYAAARDLDFGPRGGIVEYNVKFSRVVECLATVDVLDLFFDVKLVYNLVVDAMETFGRRNEVVWDTLLMAELLRRAHFRASAAIPRAGRLERRARAADGHASRAKRVRTPYHEPGRRVDPRSPCTGSSGAREPWRNGLRRGASMMTFTATTSCWPTES